MPRVGGVAKNDGLPPTQIRIPTILKFQNSGPRCSGGRGCLKSRKYTKVHTYEICVCVCVCVGGDSACPVIWEVGMREFWNSGILDMSRGGMEMVSPQLN